MDVRFDSMSATDQPSYLQPYARAVKRHGAEFRALLWASRRTQEQRFAALVRLADPTDLQVLDLGCGRADLLEFLITRGMPPRQYIGIEGVVELAAAAEKNIADGRIIRADFLRQPHKMNIGADIVYCSGALNTLDNGDFYRTIKNSFAAAGRALVFNFLSSPLLAGVNYLRWHEPRVVMRLARTLTPEVQQHDGYIDGDCTMALWKAAVAR
jgi:SAM-dependent methyltransferase